MKNLWKVLGAIFVASLVFGLISCSSDDGGEGSTVGNKWDRTVTVDARQLTGDNVFRRYFKEFSSKEKLQGIDVTIKTCATDKNGVKTIWSNKSVVGYMFGYHPIGEKVDFYLIGIRPSDMKFYIEHYNISKGNLKDGELDVTVSGQSLGDYVSITTSTKGTVDSSKTQNGAGDWCQLENTDYTETDGEKSVQISIKQPTPGKWKVKVGKAEYEFDDKDYNSTIGEVDVSKITLTNADANKKDGQTIENFNKYYTYVGETDTEHTQTGWYAQGGACIYVNAKKNGDSADYVVAEYIHDKESVVGALFAVPAEE